MLNLHMPTTNELQTEIKLRIERNKAYFVAIGVEFSIFEPTATGLKKSILDATRPVRSHFESENFHSFDKQGQGDEHKEIKKAYFVTPNSIDPTKVSLYRPKTKKGDPRMWFSNLGRFAQPSDQIAIVVFNGELFLFNFTKIDFESLAADSAAITFIAQYTGSKNSIADELLQKLREIAKAPIKVAVVGDTAVGMAVELALNIAANSSKQPDYKGIELKSGRGSKNRSNLFAQVADWNISPCKSSAEILDKYGYHRGNDFKLYCTISTQKMNSQGLQFFYDEATDQLIEKDKNGKNVAIWSGKVLRERFIEKHAETFWIQAKSTKINGVEHFDLISVTHTKRPIVSQLLPMIQSGIITMDHLIKRKGGDKPTVSEKGPLFKINKRDLPLLFPEPKTYTLKS
ncbi:MvaI/BcnI family restriction endonuclease [Methylotenera sp.]|uniref:MvaI/BcnI family restriction endonuclease n=1 Tax=Methylotenera sp. TaxID=2051956 RepID=UPI002734938B|nr:MvaI/BcnI family restriction endonuclease [Methylotenera sp.]MDP3778403.1 MvaI/BcnI family restriction endonuclease [Methylotenera sp.]